MTQDVASSARETVFAAVLRPYGPRLPLADLVYEVNQLFHASEAKEYDRRHPEIRQQLPAVWQRMIDQIATSRPASGWTVLDFGCGTGFASEQILKLPSQLPISGKSLVMTRRWRCWTVARPNWHRGARVEFVSDFNRLLAQPRRFTLLTTNSVLHHLPDPFATMRKLQERPDARRSSGWQVMSLHAGIMRMPIVKVPWPLTRRNTNGAGCSLWDYYGEHLRTWLAGKKSPAQAAASAAAQRGLFAVAPPARIIGRLVDFHVPHGLKGHQQEGGFDLEVMSQHLAPSWKLAWAYSYSFMGRFQETALPREWAAICQRLAAKYPLDGANFCSVWRVQP